MMDADAILHISKVLKRGAERPGIGVEWLADWTAKEDKALLAEWLNPEVYPPMAFSQWCTTEVPGEKQHLVTFVWKALTEAIAADTEKLQTAGFLLASHGEIHPYWGRLVSLDVIEEHPDLQGMEGVGNALELLDGGGWIRHRNYLRPCPELNEAVFCAFTEETKLSPLGACIALADDTVAGILLHQARYWQPQRRREGRRWREQSRERWRAQTRLTRHQHDRALAILKRRGLVEVKQFERRGIGHLRVLRVVAQGPRLEPEL